MNENKQSEPVALLIEHPIQPLQTDKEGVLRFKENSIVRFLSEGKLNELAVMGFPREDWVQFAQLIGYSLSGWGTLSYVSDEDWERANQTHPTQPVQPAGAQGEPVGEVIDHERACLFGSQKLKYGALLYTAPPAAAINEQLLEALKELMYARTDKAEGMADAAIAAAEAAKKGGA